MRAVSLYSLTRLEETSLYSLYEKALSQRDEEKKVRVEEIDMIRSLCMNLRLRCKSMGLLDNWFYSFSIPQIGKEFDLLKIEHGKLVINLELKSQPVAKEQIEKQLKQNRYYLSHLGEEIYSFAYVRECETIASLYMYDDELKNCTFDKLIECLLKIKVPISENIEGLFRAKDFLISPLNTPEKFLNNQYYLTLQQESIKREICMERKGLWGIKGSAGTGKTLLLYDIAKEFGKTQKVYIVHCGVLSEGHRYLSKHLKEVCVLDAKSLRSIKLEQNSAIFVDETQRLYGSGMDMILEAFENDISNICVFSYDYAQSLSKKEVARNNPKRLNEIDGFQECKLTDKIRTNKEIFSFIRNMMRITDKPQSPISYKNIDVLFAGSIDVADIIINEYNKRGYQFITLTPSQYVGNLIDHYSGYINSHHVIGQEFDNVVVVLDNNFRYSEDGILQGKEHPNPNYLFPRLFYQNISRAREKLCIIVLDNIELFTTLLEVKEQVTK